MVGLSPDPVGVKAPQPAVAVGSEITFEGKVVGTVTSAAWSPTLGCPVALGYVHRTVTSPSIVELGVVAREGTGPEASVVAAEVRTLPLL